MSSTQSTGPTWELSGNIWQRQFNNSSNNHATNVFRASSPHLQSWTSQAAINRVSCLIHNSPVFAAQLHQALPFCYLS